jgi:23S rRNA (guanosine2251-2'-O)-methyltransferase
MSRTFLSKNLGIMRIKKKMNVLNRSQYYMYGIHVVLAATKNSNRLVEKIFCLQKFADEYKNKLKNHNIEIVQNDFIIKKIGKDQPHQGVIAFVTTIFKNHIDELKFYPTKDRVVILDQISDPQNIGAIIRSAAAFNIDKVILPKDNAPDENASIAKAASGCLELVQIAKVTNIKHTIEALKNKGFWIVGLDSEGKNSLKEVVDIDKLAVIIGSEGKGMRKLTSESCDFLTKIPISDKVESLNASNAASIIFHLLYR